MEPNDVLNALLANACPIEHGEEEFEYIFELDLHCTVARVTAKLVSTLGAVQYEVLRMEMV